MLKEQRTLCISQGAAELYVTSAWLRFGERLGALSLARRNQNGWRYYSMEDIERSMPVWNWGAQTMPRCVR